MDKQLFIELFCDFVIAVGVDGGHKVYHFLIRGRVVEVVL